MKLLCRQEGECEAGFRLCDISLKNPEILPYCWKNFKRCLHLRTALAIKSDIGSILHFLGCCIEYCFKMLLSDYDNQLYVDYKSVMVGAFKECSLALDLPQTCILPPSFFHSNIYHAHNFFCYHKPAFSPFHYFIFSFTSDCNDDINFESVPLFAPLSTQNSPYMCILPNKRFNFEGP